MLRSVILVSQLLAVAGGSYLRAQALAGRVVQDDTGAPIPSAEVRVYRTGVAGLAADLETNGDGRFEAAGLVSGEYRIQVSKPNYASTSFALRHDPASAEPITIRLVRYAAITGRVVNAAGQPVRSASVLLMTRSPSGVLRPFRRLGTGTYAVPEESGRYRLYGLPPGEYVAAVSYGASTSAVGSTSGLPPRTGAGSGLLLYPNNSRPQVFTIAGGEELAGIDFVLIPGPLANVSGKLDVPAGDARYWVALTSVEQPALASAVAPAQEDGSFRLEGVAPGSYYVSAVGPVRGYGAMGAVIEKGAMFGRIRVEVAGTDVTGVSVRPAMGANGGVRLRVTPGSDQDCPPNAELRVSSLEDWAASLDRTVRAGRDQDARLENLAPGRYAVSAGTLGPNCYQVADAMLDLSGGDARVDVLLGAAGSIDGHVNAPGAIVLLTPTGDGAAATQAAAADANGRFSFSGLAPGRYRVGVRRETTTVVVVSGKAVAVELTIPAQQL